MLRRLDLKTKKGQMGFEQIFFVLASMFAIAIFIVILYYTWTQMATPLDTALSSAIPDGETSINITSLHSKVTTGTTIFNVMFPFLVVGFIVFVIISAFYINSNPVFFFIAIILLVITILLGAVFSNVYQQLTTTTALAESGETFKITQMFMKNLPIIITVIIAILMIILFTQFGNRGRGGGL